LWGLPPVALIAGAIGLVLMARRRKETSLAPEALSTEEQRRLSTLVDSAARKH
jgi:cytochrome c-type biogenesis protein CcmH/NrfF